MASHKVVMVIAFEGFQPIEYKTPKKILEDEGYTVITASNHRGTATAKDDSQALVDLPLDLLLIEDYDALIFVGGPGALDALDNAISYRLIKEAVASHKVVAAICISTRILAKAGVLENIAATGWDGDNELAALYDQYNVNYRQAPVVIDSGFITAEGPAAAAEFGHAIVKALESQS